SVAEPGTQVWRAKVQDNRNLRAPNLGAWLSYAEATHFLAVSLMTATRHILVCLLFALALLGLWAGLGRSVKLPDVASASHKLQCVSYSPFGKDQSPFDEPFILRPAQMDADLALLASRFE